MRRESRWYTYCKTTGLCPVVESSSTAKYKFSEESLMKSLRKITLSFGIVAAFAVAPVNVFAADFYIAQTAAGSVSGTSCADAFAYTWFNTLGNWANPKESGKIGPGDTVHLCGIISGDGNTDGNMLTIQKSGSIDQPITIYFEPNSKLSSPVTKNYIYAINRSYFTIDGGSNGIIENTNNGTGSTYGGTYTYQKTSNGIFCYNPGGDGITIKNLTIQNIYVLLPSSADSNYLGGGIFLNGSNIDVHNVTVSNAYIGISFLIPATGSSYKIHDCSFTAVNWGINIGGGSGSSFSGVALYDNIIDGLDVWENTGSHRDGIFFHTDGNISNIYIYRNRIGPGFNPQTKTAGTAAIYFSGNIAAQGTYNNVYVFNNLFLLKSPLGWSGCTGAACIGGLGSGGLIANNTFVAGSNGTNGPSVYQSEAYIYNNIIYRSYNAINISSATTDPRTRNITSDTNIFYNINTNNGYTAYNGSTRSYVCMNDTLAQWLNCTKNYSPKWDTNSLTSDPLFVNSTPVLGTCDYHLQAASPAIGKGLNLASFATQITSIDDSEMGRSAAAALLVDRDGKARPTAVPWDIGAYQYQDPAKGLSEPSGLRIVQ